ncbi:MAG: hypothetical protein ABI382_00660 [Nakamurella sp.]
MRPVTWVRGGFGMVLVCWPAAVVAVYSGRKGSHVDRWVARVLGVRQLAQAIGTAGLAPRPVLLLGAEVDVAHALSMLALAACVKSRRRAGLVDALVAGSFAVAGVVLAVRAPTDRPTGDQVGTLEAVRRMRNKYAATLAKRVQPAWIVSAGVHSEMQEM